MRTFEHIGIGIPQVYLPAKGVDLVKWAVVACDQYTSEPEYWQQVERIVGDSPSTLRLVLPEIYLGTAQEAEQARSVNLRMREYLEQGLLVPHEGLFYIERWFGSKCRRGILLCLDLEKYDFQKGSQSLIRATEGTIVERLPPRIKIREQATLEVPHIIVLIDDPERTVIEPLGSLAGRETGQLLEHYDFDLMLDSGHLAGFQIVDPQVELGVIRALEALAEPESFRRKYGLGADQSVFLFAMGDGNHSLATAKSIWEKNKHKCRHGSPVAVCPGGDRERPRRGAGVRPDPPRAVQSQARYPWSDAGVLRAGFLVHAHSRPGDHDRNGGMLVREQAGLRDHLRRRHRLRGDRQHQLEPGGGHAAEFPG